MTLYILIVDSQGQTTHYLSIPFFLYIFGILHSELQHCRLAAALNVIVQYHDSNQFISFFINSIAFNLSPHENIRWLQCVRS